MSELASVIEDLRLVYANFYCSKSRPCLCTEKHKYPDVMVVEGFNVVCPAHLWLDKRELYQRQIVELGGLMPPSGSVVSSTMSAEVTFIGSRLKKWQISDKLSYRNPFWEPPQIIEDDVGNTRFVPAKLGMCLANVIYREREKNKEHWAEHPVALVTKSDLINMMFSDPDLYKDMLVLPPILIIADTRDKRMSFEEIVTPIYSREYGFAFIFSANGG